VRFGQTWDEVENSTTTSNNGYIKYFKNDTTTFRVLQEPADWIGYWEHFNPGGYPFPCTTDRSTCPGCTSRNEKMKSASRRIAIQVLEGEYVNVYKFPKTLADKLSNRADRNGSACDRDYTVIKIKTRKANGDIKVDYDLEGHDKIAVDTSGLQFNDVEQMLADAYEQAWGDSDSALQTQSNAEQKQDEDEVKSRLKVVKEEPEWAVKEEPKEWTEDELRALPFEELVIVCDKEGESLPDELMEAENTDKAVDWLINH